MCRIEFILDQTVKYTYVRRHRNSEQGPGSLRLIDPRLFFQQTRSHSGRLPTRCGPRSRSIFHGRKRSSRELGKGIRIRNIMADGCARGCGCMCSQHRVQCDRRGGYGKTGLTDLGSFCPAQFTASWAQGGYQVATSDTTPRTSVTNLARERDSLSRTAVQSHRCSSPEGVS